MIQSLSLQFREFIHRELPSVPGNQEMHVIRRTVRSFVEVVEGREIAIRDETPQFNWDMWNSTMFATTLITTIGE